MQWILLSHSLFARCFFPRVPFSFALGFLVPILRLAELSALVSLAAVDAPANVFPSIWSLPTALDISNDQMILVLSFGCVMEFKYLQIDSEEPPEQLELWIWRLSCGDYRSRSIGAAGAPDAQMAIDLPSQRMRVFDERILFFLPNGCGHSATQIRAPSCTNTSILILKCVLKFLCHTDVGSRRHGCKTPSQRIHTSCDMMRTSCETDLDYHSDVVLPQKCGLPCRVDGINPAEIICEIPMSEIIVDGCLLELSCSTVSETLSK